MIVKEKMIRYCLGNSTCMKRAEYRVIDTDKAGNHEETAYCEEHKPKELDDDKDLSQ